MAKFWLHWLRLCCMAFLFFSSEELQGSVYATNVEEIAEDPLIREHEMQDAAGENYYNWQTNENDDKELNFIKCAANDLTGARAKKDMTYNALQNVDSLQNISRQNFLKKLFANQRNKMRTNLNGIYGKKYVLDWPKLQQYKRNEILQELLDRLSSVTILEPNAGKRAPHGFTGMRGKRPDDYSTEIIAKENSFEKRELNDEYADIYDKKDADHQSFKRSFYFDRAEAVGRKRFPDFSNKFVAVRGKKDIDFNSIGKPLNTRELYFVDMFPAFLYESNGKRAPSGFIGMRGKRNAAPITNV